TACSRPGAYILGLPAPPTAALVRFPTLFRSSYTASVVQGHSYAWDIASCSTLAGGDNTTNCPNRTSNWTFTMAASAPAAPTQLSISSAHGCSPASWPLRMTAATGAGAYSLGL